MRPGATSVDVVQSRFWQTNTGIITAPDGGVVLIDPGVFPDELAALARRIGKGRVLAALATHEDWDHVLWSDALGRDVPRLAHRDVVRALDEERSVLLHSLTEAEREFSVAWEHDLVGRLQPIATGTATLGDHIRLTVLTTPGHTPVHTSLVLEGEGILFAGDMLSDVDPPMLMDTSGVTATYLTSLETLAPLVSGARTIIPGHGRACDTGEASRRLERDRRYIDVLIESIRNEATADIAVRSAEVLDDPRLGWNEGWNAHLANIETIRRYG
jgi:hydroxyacylglutathione hydrolase